MGLERAHETSDGTAFAGILVQLRVFGVRHEATAQLKDKPGPPASKRRERTCCRCLGFSHGRVLLWCQRGHPNKLSCSPSDLRAFTPISNPSSKALPTAWASTVPSSRVSDP